MARKSKSDLIVTYIDNILNNCYQRQLAGDMSESEVREVVIAMQQLARLVAYESMDKLAGHFNLYN